MSLSYMCVEVPQTTNRIPSRSPIQHRPVHPNLDTLFSTFNLFLLPWFIWDSSMTWISIVLEATGLSTPGSLEMWWCKMAAQWEQEKTDQYRNGRNEPLILHCDFKNVFMGSVFSFYQQKHHHFFQILRNGPLNLPCKAGPSCLTIHNTLPKNILAFGTSLSWVNWEQIIQRMVKANEIQPS